jgi:quercetin dioxygenase-like cupin family protein
MDKVATGNFEADSAGVGQWITGHGVASPLNNDKVAIKWSRMSKGEKKIPPAGNRTNKIIAILISGKFKVTLADEPREYILEKMGDYIYLPPRSKHAAEALEDALLIFVRWPAQDGQY